MILPVILHLPPRLERLAAGSRRALLLTERAATEETRQVIAAATADAIAQTEAATKRNRASKGALLALLALAARHLRARFEAAIFAGRRAARAAAHNRLQQELEVAAEELHQVPPGALARRGQDEEDHQHAALVADSYSTAWRAALVAALLLWLREPSASLSARLRDAARSQDHRAERIVVTEVASAFGEEHADAAAGAAARVALKPGHRAVVVPGSPYRSPPADAPPPPLVSPVGTTPAPLAPGGGGSSVTSAEVSVLGLLVRRWDAKLDRVCPRCARLDGTIALVGGSFESDLIPGRVHPHCRCTESVIPLTAKLLAFQRARATMGDVYQVTPEDVRQVRQLVRRAA